MYVWIITFYTSCNSLSNLLLLACTFILCGQRNNILSGSLPSGSSRSFNHVCSAFSPDPFHPNPLDPFHPDLLDPLIMHVQQKSARPKKTFRQSWRHQNEGSSGHGILYIEIHSDDVDGGRIERGANVWGDNGIIGIVVEINDFAVLFEARLRSMASRSYSMSEKKLRGPCSPRELLTKTFIVLSSTFLNKTYSSLLWHKLQCVFVLP